MKPAIIPIKLVRRSKDEQLAYLQHQLMKQSVFRMKVKEVINNQIELTTRFNEKHQNQDECAMRLDDLKEELGL